MKRSRMDFLVEWLNNSNRKPLVIRGARQVGKTWLVRQLAKSQNLQLVELNFEKRPSLSALFNSNNPQEILLNIGAALNITINPETSLLFLDEIQVVPELFAKLRWFAEDFSQLPIIAAGSLLEFVLSKHSFSMPVGRISYMHLEPLSFEEFLEAKNEKILIDYLSNYQWVGKIPDMIHEKLLKIFKEYIVIGGMPAAVSSWITTNSLKEVNQIHYDLLATYRDDFAKYSGQIAVERLDEVLMSIPKSLGEKFVYTKVNRSIQTNTIKQSLNLLCKAKICHRVNGCAANGVPLAAEINEKYLKMIFLDVGLCSVALGLTLDQLSQEKEISLINKGGIAEQVVGQLLRTISPPYVEPMLFYWHREEKGSSAEIDYIISHNTSVIPVEVKAGSTGRLKSLHIFMGLKNLAVAFRINSDQPSQTLVDLEDNLGNHAKYKLFSLPFYLLGQLNRLLKEESLLD